MPHRLLILGIDALDWELVHKYESTLPHISRLRREGHCARMTSVWPPDSETCWASIYTGLNPARHGVFHFVDPLEKSATYLTTERDNAFLQGKTFWDLAGAAGRKVIVLFPHIGYPCWAVNGLMISRSSATRDICIYPPEERATVGLEGLNEVHGLAGPNPQRYLEGVRAQVLRQLELTLEILSEGQDWDLLFAYWPALDLIQHQFWSYCDPNDPSFPGVNPYQDVIREFYALHDRILGEIVRRIDSQTSLMVLSDHGHGARPSRLLNINRILRDKGYLVVRTRFAGLPKDLVRVVRGSVTRFVSGFRLGKAASVVIRKAPWAKQLYIAANSIDFRNSLAYTTDLSGIKAYSYGGIKIIKENLDSRSYDEVCRTISEVLMEATDPERPSARPVQSVVRRDELYEGRFQSQYPDLVFELEEGYGAGWDPDGELIETSETHMFYPGTHLARNAVFILSGPLRHLVRRGPDTLMDIAPTVLHILELPVPRGLDGESILVSG